MAETLGEKLRQAREERGITISEVAEQTRISPHYLELIEVDDYRTLPGGIFNKGFVKSYAKYVGIDEVEALQDYSRIISTQTGEPDDEPKTYRPEVLTDDYSSSSSWSTVVFAVIILGLMSLGIYALVSYLQSEPSAITANANQANANVSNSNIAVVNTQSTPAIPATNEIKLELKPTAEAVSVSSTIDGKTVNGLVTPDAPKTYIGLQSVKIGYYKGFAGKVQLTLNGKQIAAPPAPARGTSIIFEINKGNIAQTLQSGQIQPATATAPTAR